MEKTLSIIVPYRDRQENLNKFLPNCISFIEKNHPDLKYRISIIEQYGNEIFNRGQMKYIGFDLTKDLYTHFIFHDVDNLIKKGSYLPQDGASMLGVHPSQFGYKLAYPTFFGIAVMFDRDLFIEVNGYSNEYRGYSSEDDDLYWRVTTRGHTVSYVPNRYVSLDHKRDDQDKEIVGANWRRLESGNLRCDIDGINSLSYEVKDKIEYDDYTHYFVDISKYNFITE